MFSCDTVGDEIPILAADNIKILGKFVTQPCHLVHEVHLVPLLDLLQLGLVQLDKEAEEVGRVTAGVQELLTPAGAKTGS